ncbi:MULTISPECIES: ferritin-like domain-containing protein [unclassified Rhodococcus (in: high G+C Gram-positive bacteria)]|uniref:ferritin-like domain-containing protein n=1 Tax=unclassified Rhodococcus (in: high G+C Gram-positive bacteria) TaxID=192944 RepID=UPI00211AB08F|nr:MULTISPECIES: ferritin-like domain-containing protein [unclassified Rhodococcus (in: high G+C Gram-positive bacteria)]
MGAHSPESSSPAVASTALVGSSDPDRGEPAIAHDHPGVPDLFAVLAYGEISAFYRLAEDARMAPSMEGRVALASMAAAEMSHFETLEQALSNRGLDVYSSMDPFVRALDEYHASTTPSTWLESLVKAYVGDGIAADFYRQIAHSLAPDVAEIVRDVLAETGHSEFVVHEVSERVRASSQDKARLMLWGRRLLGEAITQAQFVLAQRESLTDLVITASGDLNGVVALFDRMQEQHAERMSSLGLD